MGSSYTYNAVALLGFLGYVSASLVHNENGDYIYEFQLSSSEADKGSIPVTEIDVDGHTRACIALRTLRNYGHSVEWDESSNTVFVDYEGSGEEYVTLLHLDDFGFFMGSTETEREDSVKELNKILETYAITTDLRIAFFMGQVKHESRRGERTLESFSGSSPEEYFNNKYSNRSNLGNEGSNDGELFRGSGYIHLTGRYNYQEFANYLGDQQIMIDGYRLVGGVYNRPIQNINSSDVGVIDIGEFAWESCGWFWNRGNPKTTDLNTYADKKDWYSISSAINQYDTATFPIRNKYINEFYDILTGQSLGLPDK